MELAAIEGGIGIDAAVFPDGNSQHQPVARGVRVWCRQVAGTSTDDIAALVAPPARVRE